MMEIGVKRLYYEDFFYWTQRVGGFTAEVMGEILKTRADAMAIINRVLDRGVSQGSTLLSYHAWPDNDPTAWYYYEIIEATNAHEYTGTRPNENWTKIF